MTQNLPFLPSPRFPKALLLQVLELAAGVPCVWTTAKRPMLGPLDATKEVAWVLVSVPSRNNEGTDELRRVYQPAPLDANAALQGGQRSCTVSLRAVSMDETLEAMDLLARIQFQLRTAKCAALYVGVLALQEFHPILNLGDETVEDRVVWTATMDVRLGYVDQSDPVDPQEGGYIASSDVPNNGTLDGNPVGPLGPGA